MYIFSLDVECLGLYGPVFSVGVSIIDNSNNGDNHKCEVDNLFLRVDHTELIKNNTNEYYYNDHDVKWVDENVIPALGPINCNSLLELRNRFWQFYLEAKNKYPNMIVISDCGSPCESGFFRTCIMDDAENRKWNGPYPLHELGTLLLMRGKDPIGTYQRNPNELPKHNPLCDARQSARLWIENFW